MVCIPGTSSRRTELTLISSGLQSVVPLKVPSGAYNVPITHLSLRVRLEIIPSANVIAVPLGASSLWM